MAENQEEETNDVKTDSKESLLKELELQGMGQAIHKESAKKYCKLTVGSIFDEELATVLVDHMKADENDMIDSDGVMAPFSAENWPREVLVGVVDLLENSEELQEGYKNMLYKVLNLKMEEVEEVSSHNLLKAVDFIKDQLRNTPSDGDVSSSELLRAFESKCHFVDSCNIEPEDEQQQLVIPNEEDEDIS